MDKTLVRAAYEAALSHLWGHLPPLQGELPGQTRQHFEAIAAAVVAAHEAAQLMTWEEAMAWATEGGARRYVLGYWEERESWVRVSPETAYNRSGRQFTGAFTDDCRHTWSPGELTHFRKLPPAPPAKEGK